MRSSISIANNFGPRTRWTEIFFFEPTGFYYGPPDWAIDYLGRVGATERRFEVRPFLSRLLDVSRALQPLYQEYAVHGALLVGDLGTALMVMGGHSQSKPHHVALAPSQYLSVCSLAAPSQWRTRAQE
jgi:hypothetical protein